MGGSPPVPSASLRTLMHIEFDKDSSSEMEFDEDSSSEMEFDEDIISEMESDEVIDETPKLIEDAEDFEGNLVGLLMLQLRRRMRL